MENNQENDLIIDDDFDYEESNGVYVIDDFYESLTEDKKTILSQLRISDQQIDILKKENNQKFNKMKLLLYQKFLNIFFSILTLNIRKNFKIFLEKAKIFRIKNLGFNLDSNNKSHENFKKFKKDEEKINIKPSSHEIEYKKHLDKLKLEKLKKEEKKKFEEDIIQKQKYADNIYEYLIKRKIFRNMILNVELNKVSITFLENIHNKMIKKNYVNKFKFIYDIRQERKLKLEKIKFDNATKFYELNLKIKVFKFIYGNYEINTKLLNYYIKSIQIKRKKIVSNKFLKIIKLLLYNTKVIENEIKTRIIGIIKKKYSRLLFKGLKIIKEEVNDKIFKDELIRKLKDKANFFMGSDFNISN